MFLFCSTAGFVCMICKPALSWFSNALKFIVQEFYRMLTFLGRRVVRLTKRLLGGTFLLSLAWSSTSRLGINNELWLFLEAVSCHDVFVVAARVLVLTQTSSTHTTSTVHTRECTVLLLYTVVHTAGVHHTRYTCHYNYHHEPFNWCHELVSRDQTYASTEVSAMRLWWWYSWQPQTVTTPPNIGINKYSISDGHLCLNDKCPSSRPHTKRHNMQCVEN